jgi:hypothetical protein
VPAKSEMPAKSDMPADKAALLLHAADGERVLLPFAVQGAAVRARAPIAALPANPRLPTRIALEASIRTTLVLEEVTARGSIGAEAAIPWRWTINRLSGDGATGKPLFRVRRNGALTLTLVNRTPVPQQMLLHGHCFRVLHDLDDGWDPYWRTSLLLAPGKTKHIAFVADNPGKWALESSMPARQVTGLAGWFEVAA